MEDLIPLLIVIAISLIGAFRKKKKRVPFENQAPESRERKEKDDIFSWLENLADPDEEEEIPYTSTAQEAPVQVTDASQKEATAPEKVETANNKYKKYTGFVSQKKKEELALDGKDVRQKFTGTFEKSKPLELTEISGKTRSKHLHDFDLKKAVIYSEIINRKY